MLSVASLANLIKRLRHYISGHVYNYGLASLSPGILHVAFRHTVLEHYLFKGRAGNMLLALGVGSLFNHSQKPNLDYRIDHDQLMIRYFAAREIMPEEELTIFYGDKLWFEDTKEQTPLPNGLMNANTSHEHMDNEDTFLGHMTL